MLKKVIQRYAVAFGMAAAMFAAGAGGIQKANAAEIADQAGSVQESETVRQSETPQESEMQRQPETTQQSETTGQSETLPLKNVKKAPKLSGKWVKQHGKVRFLLQDKTYATKTWANIKGRYYYFDKNGFRRQGLFRYRNGKTYYLGKKGAMVTGWQKIRKHWYYFGKNGAMKKASWIRTKTGYAYVDAKGKRVVSSWVKVKGKKYYIDEKGVKVTKSRYIGNKAYYFDKKGVYHKDKKIKERLINPKGKMVALTFDDGPGPYTNAQIRALTGHNATLVRPPYGAYNSNVQINAGAPLILWSIDTLDWKTRNAKNTINVVMNEVKDGSIILMHDIHSPSVDAAEVLIPKLIASGYQLVTVSELAKYRSVAMYSGGVYNAFYR